MFAGVPRAGDLILLLSMYIKPRALSAGALSALNSDTLNIRPHVLFIRAYDKEVENGDRVHFFAVYRTV